jgi:DNA replicative helicase MCM subunit Mcm2 (Cdc46/Mcm family)
MKIRDWLSTLKKLDEDTQYNLEHIGAYISPAEKEQLETLLKTRKVKVREERFPADTALPEHYYPVLTTKEKEFEEFVQKANSRVLEGTWNEQLAEFSKYSKSWIEQHIAPNVKGLERVKNALVTLLLAKDIHVLLVGGKEVTQELFAGVHGLAHVSALGTVKDIQANNSILGAASGGVCCIMDVQELRPGDRTMLYTAMEYGYVKLDRGVQHERLAADVCVLAAATTKTALKPNSDIKKLTGLDNAFLSRFHLIFLLSSGKLEKSKPVSAADATFVKRYLTLAATHKPTVPIELAERVRCQHEKAELILALAKASARLELRDEVLRRDIDEATQLV